MTTISWNGGPILKGGAVGTEQACCCGCAPCCIDGTRVAGPLYDTQAECEAEGGVWVPTADCSSFPECSPPCDGACKFCVDGVCVDVSVTAEWCGLTASVGAPASTAITPCYVCDDALFEVCEKTLSVTVDCYRHCNCLTVVAGVYLMEANFSDARVYSATRSICGSSLSATDTVLKYVGFNPSNCPDWYAAAGCDVAPTVVINFAP